MPLGIKILSHQSIYPWQEVKGDVTDWLQYAIQGSTTARLSVTFTYASEDLTFITVALGLNSTHPIELNCLSYQFHVATVSLVGKLDASTSETRA